MRASVDANVLISFLLAPTADSPPAATILAALQGRYQMCLSIAMLQEVYGNIAKKPYLSRRITPKLAERLAANLMLVVEIAEDTPDVASTSTRDQNDDYLIAHAVFAHVDYIVSGDRDLLELEHNHPFRVVSPAEFVRLLEQEQQRP